MKPILNLDKREDIMYGIRFEISSLSLLWRVILDDIPQFVTAFSRNTQTDIAQLAA